MIDESKMAKISAPAIDSRDLKANLKAMPTKELRKLLALVERGYLVREGDGLFTLGEAYDASQFFDDLKPLLGETVQAEK